MPSKKHFNMTKYKLSNYNYYIVKPDCAVWVNTRTDNMFSIDLQKHAMLLSDLNILEKQNFPLFSVMCKLGVILHSDFSEVNDMLVSNRKTIFSDKNYRLTINPTLECNFGCWYCYETHTKGRMGAEMVDRIVKHVQQLVSYDGISGLHLDWFGGEPLLCFDDVVYPLSIRLKKLMEGSKRWFRNSATTNGYNLDKESIKKLNHIDLKNFQITLDGYEEQHNQIRKAPKGKNSYRTIVNNINLICELVESATVAVRINYTKETLENINEIMKDFSETSKNHITFLFQQVWQDKTKLFKEIEEVEQLFKLKGFKVDERTVMKSDHKCYADKLYQAVINSDGRVFKCTARDFATFPEDGILDESGEIIWNEEKYNKRMVKATFENKYCLPCRFLPVCLGPCSQKMVEFTGDNFEEICLKEGVELGLIKELEYFYERNKVKQTV